jgi:hypothetical protein
MTAPKSAWTLTALTSLAAQAAHLHHPLVLTTNTMINTDVTVMTTTTTMTWITMTREGKAWQDSRQ